MFLSLTKRDLNKWAGQQICNEKERPCFLYMKTLQLKKEHGDRYKCVSRYGESCYIQLKKSHKDECGMGVHCE